MKRPKVIIYNNRVVPIIKDNKECNNNGAYGLYTYEDHLITYADRFMGLKLSDEHIEHTVLHEIFHSMFHEYGRMDLAKNEKLVDTLSKYLQEIIPQLYDIRDTKR